MGSKVQDSVDPIDEYIREHSLRLTSEQKEIIEYTSTLPSRCLSSLASLSLFDLRLGRLSIMLGSLDEAQFFQLILPLFNCRRCSEIS